jgi:glycosyltransferase involved in cell wall biosynthesis
LGLDQSYIHQWIIAKLYRNVDGVIGVSQSRLDKALSLFRLRMPGVMIPNGVDFARFNQAVSGQRSKFSLSSDHFVVLCPSRMMPVKGVVYFAKAVNLMVERYSQIPWRFVFLGNEVNEKDVTDRAYINEIKKILRSVHEQEFVVYFGNVPPENMPDIYALADIVVLPSLMEAISLSALEAMATQRAVIASRIEGLQELIEERETGILVTPKDPEQLAHAIYTLYGNKGLRKQLAEKGEEVSKQYSWTKIAKLTADFYKRILEKQ